MAGWSGVALLWTVLTARDHSVKTRRGWRSASSGGLATSAITYLIAEWTYRPVTALALAGSVPERSGSPGVRLKLSLRSALGADVFLIMIGLTFGRPRSEPPAPAGVVYFVAGLAAGTVVLYTATRSLVTPLVELRRSAREGQDGNLDAKVEVNDGAEIGLLQAGFKQTVVGLHERRQLHDLSGRHVGAEVARRALEQGVSLGGERREVAVIFLDVIGSTGLAQRESPEAVLDLLNAFFGTIVRVVAAEGGGVNSSRATALCASSALR